MLLYHCIVFVTVYILPFSKVFCDHRYTNVELTFSKSSVSFLVNSEYRGLTIKPSGLLEEDAVVYFTYDPQVSSLHHLDNVTIPRNDTSAVGVTLVAGGTPMHVILGMASNSTQITKLNDSYLYVSLIESRRLQLFSNVVGWMYFIAWSISFYPQIILNIRRRSVVGLNFDYLALNFVGFLCYTVFNVGLFFIKTIQREYDLIHPHGIIPVKINDVVFAIHALILTVVTIAQCFCLQRDNQRVSRVCMLIILLIFVTMVIMIGLLLGDVVNLLEFFYFVSYVKLGITIIKYIPQAWFNFRCKSTVGWSIGNILLDFTGGSLSILQMFLLAYNNDDWSSLFGNPTKFGLGFFSLVFDVLFIIQHYCLYRHRPGYSRIVPGPGDKPENPEIKPDVHINSDAFVNHDS